MPIFQLHGRQVSKSKQEPSLQPPTHGDSMRRLSEESVRTEDCEGLVPDTPMEDSHPQHESNGESNDKEGAVCTNRAELIERIKRGESPTWVPNQAVSGKKKINFFGQSPGRT